MPIYRYRALTPPGEVVEGDLEAPDQGSVIDYLRARGYLPLRAEERRDEARGFSLGRRRRALSRQDEVNVYRELATLLSAGLPLDQALDLMIGYATRPAIAEVMARVLASVRDGATLSKSMAAQPDVFDRFGLGMVRAGEAGGALDKALARTATYLETAERAKQNLKSALIYPTILLISAGVSVVVILAVVIPNFADIFRQAGMELPLATRVVVQIGVLAEGYWWAPLLAGLIATLVVLQGRRSEAGRQTWDRRLLRLPLIGPILTKSEVARFCYTLGMLTGNGVPLLAALAVARSTLRNAAIAAAVAAAEVQVKEGRPLAEPLSRARVFPEHATHLIRIGEESGNLEDMLFRVSDMYDEKVQQDTKRLLTLLTPALTLGMAVLISGIIVSILVPMLSIHQMAF